MATGRWARRASCGALAVLLLAGCGGSLAQTPKPAVAPVAKAAEITDIRVSGTGSAVQITVTTSAKAAYSLVRQISPPRLILELAGTTISGQPKVIPVNRGAVTVIKPSSSGANGGIEVFLTAEAAYNIEGRGTSVVLNVSPKVAANGIGPAGQPAAAIGEKKSQSSLGTSLVGELSAPVPAPTPVAATPAPMAATQFAEVQAPAPTPAPTPVPQPAASSVPDAIVPAEVPAEPVIEVPQGPRYLETISVEKQTDGLVITLKGNGPLQHEYFLVEGKSLVVDIAGAGSKVKPKNMKVGDAWVTQIRIGEHEQPKRYTRVVFDLKKLGEYRVEGAGENILVTFGAPALAAASAAGRQGAMTSLNTVGQVSYSPLDAVTRLEIPTSVKADFTVVNSGDPAKVVIEIAHARMVDKDRKTIDLSSLNREVVNISVFPFTKGDQQLVRVVTQLRQPVPYRTILEGDRLLVDFERAAPAATAAPVAAAATTAAATTAKTAATPAPAAAPPAAVASSTGPVFTGRHLSLDFKDAEVNDILRLISEVSGLNFVAGPEVKGTVSIKLADVPWDQALDLILKTNVPQLAQIRESDTIVRITTADKILDEEQRRRRIEEDKKKTLDAQKALEPVFSKTFPISYIESAKMGEFVGKLEKFKSSQGIIQFDERTKNIIVWDTAQKLVELEQVILAWDAPTPAVLVEARIVEVSSNFGQSVGVQWNANGVRDAAHGNATDFAFPNSVTVGGQQGSGAMGSMPSNYMVNLPAAVSSGGIGFSFGHIANTLSLDLRLSAGENLGKVKILSNPKVLVVQNQQAVINLGSQLPIPKTDSTGNRTVEWKDVGIKLDVKPQITNDKRVFMDINIEKSSQGDNVQTTEGTMFSINTSRAQSKVLIADGETTVIGGIFIEESTDTTDSIPGLAKIPILGWLFKNKTTKENRRELMIFITPKIVVM